MKSFSDLYLPYQFFFFPTRSKSARIARGNLALFTIMKTSQFAYFLYKSACVPVSTSVNVNISSSIRYISNQSGCIISTTFYSIFHEFSSSNNSSISVYPLTFGSLLILFASFIASITSGLYSGYFTSKGIPFCKNYLSKEHVQYIYLEDKNVLEFRWKVLENGRMNGLLTLKALRGQKGMCSKQWHAPFYFVYMHSCLLMSEKSMSRSSKY